MTDIEQIYSTLLVQNYQDILFSDLSKKRKTSSGWVACCPFHDDKNPSFSFSAHKPLWNCFGCGEHGDWIEYLEKRNALTFQEALDQLAKAAGVELRGTDRGDWGQLSAKRKDQAQALSRYFFHDMTMEFFKELLWSKKGKEALDYLGSRGYSHDEIHSLDLGYYPGQLETESYLRKQGYTQEIIQEHLKWLQWRSEYKLVIPWRDLDGNITSLWGRIIRSLKEGEKESEKYKPFSTEANKESPFLLHKATECKMLVLVEGYFDALSAAVRGIDGVVAIAGSNLTQKQLEAIEPLNIKNIILALDNDEAGRKGTERSILLLNEQKIKTYVASLPEGVKDPDELLKTADGVERFQEAIYNPLTAHQWILNQIVKQHNIGIAFERHKAQQKAFDHWEHITDALEAWEYAGYLSKTFDIPSQVLDEVLKKYQDAKTKKELEKHCQSVVLEINSLNKEAQYEKLVSFMTNSVKDLRSRAVSDIIRPHTWDELEYYIQNTKEGLKTGYSSLDHFIQIPPGALTIVAGRPAHGKTAFMLNLMHNMLEIYQEQTFVFFSYEMEWEQIALRFINLLCNKRLSRQQNNKDYLWGYIKGNKAANYDIENAKETFIELCQSGRLLLIDDPYYVHELANVVPYLKNQYDIGAVFIDYIQKIKLKDIRGTRQLELQAISAQLLESAIDLSLPIILGAQFGRAGMDKCRLDNLREAGDIEQDANLVLGLWNDTIEKKSEGEEVFQASFPSSVPEGSVPLDIHILKNRDGLAGKKITLDFNGALMKIKEVNL